MAPTKRLRARMVQQVTGSASRRRRSARAPVSLSLGAATCASSSRSTPSGAVRGTPASGDRMISSTNGSMSTPSAARTARQP